MARNRNDYFKLIEEQLSHSVRASELLGEILTNVTAENVQDYKERSIRGTTSIIPSCRAFRRSSSRRLTRRTSCIWFS